MTPDIPTVKNRIVEALSSGQVTDSSTYTRSKEYKGFYLSDNDAPVYAYSHVEASIGYDRDTIKEAMLELRNDGFVELIPAVNYDGIPNGSGWSLTEKGLHYAVDNKLVTL